MYHCKTKFHLAGNERFFPLIQNTPPLEKFTHEFVEDAGAADVIVADVSGLPDGSAVLKKLAAAKKPDAEFIVLSENYDSLGVPLNEITDVWMTPMSEEAFRFKFGKWQERFKNDKERWQSEQYLDALIDNIPSMVWFKARDGRHEKVNADFCRTVGKTREDITGKMHTYIWDVPEDDPACVESDNRAMTTETTVVSEEHIATKSGERELTSYKSPLYDIDGSVMGTVGFAVDITKERAFENEIITKNKTLENMFASIDCGMMWHSINGKDIYFINNTALKILDYKSVEELIENGFDYVARSVIEEDRGRLSEQIQSLKNTGDSVNVEYRVRHKDGKILHIMGNIKLMEEDGRQFYQRYLLDVTERRRESSEKEHRREELVQVLAANYSVVCYFDLNTGYGSAHHINDSESGELHDLFSGKLELEDTIARYCDKFVNVEDRVLLKTNCDRAFLKRTLSQKGSHFINFRMTYGGEESYYRIKAVKVGSDADVFGIVLGIRSVDEEIRRQMEDKALLENALRQANRANRAKSTFLSNMSHDIRTPMNAIVGFTTLALSHADNREQVEGYLRKIMTSGNHLLSLINDVLDMSRIESGKMTLDEKQCELPDILHGLCNMIRPEVMKKQMTLRMDTASIRHEAVVCDRLRLNQILLNLLSNSVKYTPDGGTITFRAAEKPSVNADSAMFEFTVSDNGMGMSEEFVRHIFEPFERERNSTMSGIQGTGLGMAITKNIVDMMSGTIDVKSAPGKGTEVTVLLEFKVLESAADNSRLESSLHGIRALVADDDPNTCDSISGMLGELGIKADRALSGKDAVLLAKQAAERGESYGVYMVDYKMPGQSGVETARMICEETGGNVPIIMVTAYDRAEIEAEARQAGVRAFCSKPLFMSELRNCLESLFRADEKTAARKRSGRILLVEDNDLNQEIAVTMLTEEGFEVDVAGNGKEAVDMLSASAEGHYGVVLMDIQMPVMNGYEATKCIRALENEAHRNIPIIAMTANAFAEDKKEALQCGMNGHLAKPIDIDTLLKMLDEVL